MPFPFVFEFQFDDQYPDYYLEVDWDGDGVFTGTGENVTSRLMYCEYQRGRDRVSSLTGRSSAGRLRAVLNNTSGDYSPFNTASPLYGNLLPKRKVQLRSMNDGPVVLWTGYVKRIVPQPNVMKPNLAILEAVGMLGVIAERRVRIPMATAILTDDAIEDVLEDVGLVAADMDLDVGLTTLTRWWADGKALAALRDIEAAEGGFLKETKDGKVAFENRQHRLTEATSTASQATFSDAAGAAISYTRIEEEDPLPHIFNDFRADVTLYTVGSLVVLWTLAESGAASPLIVAGQSKTFWAAYPVADSPTEDIAVNAWTTPVENTDYEANSQAGGGGSDLSANIAVAVETFATAMKITLTNNGATDAYITLLQARGTSVSRSDAIGVSAEDATSQTAYEKRTWPAPTPWIPDAEEAQDWAAYNLSLYKDPIPFLRVSFHPGRSATTRAAMQDLDLSHRVTVVAENSAGLGINEDFIIEAVRHVIDVARNNREVITYDLSPVSAYAGFWTLDVSELGISTRLAY